MKLNEMCVRKKQVRPGIYKALCDGFIMVRAGAYRVPIGTIIVPDVNLIVVKTKCGRVCWQYEPHREWWIGQVLSDDFTVKKDNQYGAATQYVSFDRKNKYDVIRVDSDGKLWVLQNDDKMQVSSYYWTIVETIKDMVAQKS